MTRISMKSNTKVTWNDGFNTFLQEHIILKNLTEATLKYYKDYVQYSWYNYYDKNSYLQDINQDTINNYVLFLKNREIKDSTINTYLKALHTIISFFKQKGWCYDVEVNLIKDTKTKIEVYSDDDIAKLLKKPDMNKCKFAEYRNWVIINFLCNTGVRRSTLINIKIEDLDLVNGYCNCTHTKNRKTLTVPLTKSMCLILQEYITKLPADCKYLFPNVLSEKMQPRTLTLEINVYNKSRGVTITSVHAFRHWFAKKSVMNGVNIVQLQHILGHSNLDILKNYVEMLTEDLQYKDASQNPLESILLKHKSKKTIKLKED